MQPDFIPPIPGLIFSALLTLTFVIMKLRERNAR